MSSLLLQSLHCPNVSSTTNRFILVHLPLFNEQWLRYWLGLKGPLQLGALVLKQSLISMNLPQKTSIPKILT